MDPSAMDFVMQHTTTDQGNSQQQHPQQSQQEPCPGSRAAAATTDPSHIPQGHHAASRPRGQLGGVYYDPVHGSTPAGNSWWLQGPQSQPSWQQQQQQQQQQPSPSPSTFSSFGRTPATGQQFNAYGIGTGSTSGAQSNAGNPFQTLATNNTNEPGQGFPQHYSYGSAQQDAFQLHLRQQQQQLHRLPSIQRIPLPDGQHSSRGGFGGPSSLNDASTRSLLSLNYLSQPLTQHLPLTTGARPSHLAMSRHWASNRTDLAGHWRPGDEDSGQPATRHGPLSQSTRPPMPAHQHRGPSVTTASPLTASTQASSAQPPRFAASPSETSSDEEVDDETAAMRYLSDSLGALPPGPEGAIRARQFMAGAMSGRRIASKTAIASLQPVPLSDLTDEEKRCIICYEQFGVANPEGINETPLRLPKCKHLFGDRCIKKWLEESDSCPYCRTKLPSESPHRHLYPQAMRELLRSNQLSTEQLNALRQPRGNAGGVGGPGFDRVSGTTAEATYRPVRFNGPTSSLDTYDMPHRSAAERTSRRPPLWDRPSPPMVTERRSRIRPVHDGSLQASSSSSSARPQSYSAASTSHLLQPDASLTGFTRGDARPAGGPAGLPTYANANAHNQYDYLPYPYAHQPEGRADSSERVSSAETFREFRDRDFPGNNDGDVHMDYSDDEAGGFR